MPPAISRTKFCLLLIASLGGFSILKGQPQLLPIFDKNRLISNAEIEALRAGHRKIIPADSAINTIFQRSTFNKAAGFMPPTLNKPLSVAAVQEFDYPLNECFTYTFKLTVGAADGVTIIKETFTSTEGNIYLVGQVLMGNGKRNGLIQLLNHQATVAWSKSLEHAGRNTTIQSIRQLIAGNLIAIGTTELADGTDKRIFITELDLAGNLVRSRSLSYAGYSGMGISTTPANGIAFCGNDDSTLVYGRMDYTGNLLSLKRIRLMEKGAIVGMTKNDYNSWYIAYTGIDSARRVGILMQINWVNGNIDYINKFGGKTANSDFIFHDLELINIRPRVCGIYSINHGPYQLFKLTGNVTGQYESVQTFEAPAIGFDITANSSLTPWAEVIAFSPTAADPNVYAVKMINEANPPNMLHWMKKFEGIGQHELVNIERSFDGGFLIANNRKTVTGMQGYILKTDSIGLIKTCEGIDFNISSNVNYGGTVATLNPVASPVAASLLQINTTVADLAVPVFFECKNLACPVVLPEDPCISSFTRKYRGAGFCDLGIDLLVEEQNRITVAAYMRDNPYEPATEKAAIAIFNEAGKLQARKKITLGNQTAITKLLRLKDGNLLGVGFGTYRSPYTGLDTGFITITKFSPDIQLLWNKSFPFYSPYSAIYGVVESGDGSIFLNYVEGKNFGDNLSLLKLNSFGEFQWLKDYHSEGQFALGYVGSMTQDKDYIYLMNWSTPDVIFLKVLKSSGNLLWSKGYRVPGVDQTLLANDLSFIGDNLVVQGRATAPLFSKDVVMLMDRDGVVKQARSFAENNQSLNLEMIVTQNHDLVLTNSSWAQGSFLRLDSTLNILHSKKAQVQPGGTYSIREGLDGSIYDLGAFWYSNAYNNDISLKKYSFDGLLGSCFVDTLVLVTEPQPVIQTNLNTTTTDDIVTLESLPYQEHAYSLQENHLLCSKVSTCNDLKLTAPASVCDTSLYTIVASRNIDCKSPVYFSWSGNDFKITSRTDTSIIVQFLNTGTTRIKAKIFTGCKWIEDSTLISTSVVFNKLDLGRDTSLCPSNSLQLNARRGYTSYLWNDGSADSVLTINSPGKYYVDVTDACGNTLSDTVLVSAAPPISFNIGPDRFKCNSDTLHLNAPAGFQNYSWGPLYNISSTNGRQVIVQPATDTIYFVKAEKTPGCFAYDTVSVKVFLSPSIDLGSDQKFCKGDSALLDAGNGFASYSWSNGSTSSQIFVQESGDYSVIATTNEGCSSYDAMRILEVWNNPAVSLDKTNELCVGSGRVLDAGYFSSYLWQDGSTAPTFTATGTGTYYVSVWDNNQCKGSDTTTITKLLPLPGNFLPADTFICSYGTLEIKAPPGFRTYLWNNNAATSSINATSPGTYWLQVTDAANCAGNDTITVTLKDCLEGFYVPTAFTPNNDGLNDQFKPLIGGNLKQYQFTIYNRWGQIVFTTSEINKGWNGVFKGVLQESHVFAWSCIYQLEGGGKKGEKGTVVLIR